MSKMLQHEAVIYDAAAIKSITVKNASLYRFRHAKKLPNSLQTSLLKRILKESAEKKSLL